jgi:hypothetical protein
VLERPRRDAAGLDEHVDVSGLETDHPPEPVGRHLSLIDEAIQRARRYAEPIGGLTGAEPTDLVVNRSHGVNGTRFSVSFLRFGVVFPRIADARTTSVRALGELYRFVAHPAERDKT